MRKKKLSVGHESLFLFYFWTRARWATFFLSFSSFEKEMEKEGLWLINCFILSLSLFSFFWKRKRREREAGRCDGWNQHSSSNLSAARSVCKVRTQEAENFDEEVKSLVSAWLFLLLFVLNLQDHEFNDFSSIHDYSPAILSCARRLFPKIKDLFNDLWLVFWILVLVRHFL